MTSAIERVVGRLHRHAHHNMIELSRLNLRALHRALGGDRAQFLRTEVAQLAAITAHGRARTTHDCDITRFQHHCLAESPDRRAIEGTAFEVGFWNENCKVYRMA